MQQDEIRGEVEAVLACEPGLDSESIRVEVADGVATLSGSVPSWAERCDAEQASLRVAGISAVANELRVDLPASSVRPDSDLAALAAHILSATVHVPPGIKLVVENGLVTLVGEADWPYQKLAAVAAVSRLLGVRGVLDHIQLVRHGTVDSRKAEFLQALRASAVSDPSHVHVEAVDGTLMLSGSVPSWADRDEAVRIAWSTSGVRSVQCCISVKSLAASSAAAGPSAARARKR